MPSSLQFHERLDSNYDASFARDNRDVAEFLNKILLSDSEANQALSFLMEERGLTEEVIREFCIGYFPRSLTVRGLPDELRRRIIIPVHNQWGDVVALSGRVIGECEGPKYYNTRFKKNSILFNFNRANREILKKRLCFVVEGAFDVISLWFRGVRNCIAMMGTGFDRISATLLFRFTDYVVVIPDHDEAGIKAYRRVKKTLESNPFCIKTLFVNYPQNYKDIDSYLRAANPREIENFCVLLNQMDYTTVPGWGLTTKDEYIIKKCTELKDKLEKVYREIR